MGKVHDNCSIQLFIIKKREEVKKRKKNLVKLKRTFPETNSKRTSGNKIRKYGLYEVSQPSIDREKASTEKMTNAKTIENESLVKTLHKRLEN